MSIRCVHLCWYRFRVLIHYRKKNLHIDRQPITVIKQQPLIVLHTSSIGSLQGSHTSKGADLTNAHYKPSSKRQKKKKHHINKAEKETKGDLKQKIEDPLSSSYPSNYYYSN